MDQNLIKKWNLVVIDDAPRHLIGKSLFDIIQFISNIGEFKFIIFDNLEGSGKDWLISSLQKKKNTVIKIDEFLPTLLDVSQIDWGDFFLFKDLPKK